MISTPPERVRRDTDFLVCREPVMESAESLLGSHKSLPPPFKGHDAPQNRMSPHLGSPSSTHGEMAQGISMPAKEIEESYVAQNDGVVIQDDNIAKPVKSEETASTEAARRTGPLELLELPLDILKDIFKEVSTCKGETQQTMC